MNLKTKLFLNIALMIMAIAGLVIISISSYNILTDELFMEQWWRVQKEYMWYTISALALILIPYAIVISGKLKIK